MMLADLEECQNRLIETAGIVRKSIEAAKIVALPSGKMIIDLTLKLIS
jgi:hypothetical protein